MKNHEKNVKFVENLENCEKIVKMSNDRLYSIEKSEITYLNDKKLQMNQLTNYKLQEIVKNR